MIIDLDSHLRESYFMDQVYKLDPPYDELTPILIQDGEPHERRYQVKFRPIGGENAGHALGTSSGVSLHAKAMVVDHREVFIGSMNFDPRSRYLNTEMGVIVDSPALAAAVERYFDHATTPANAFHVQLGACAGTRPTHWSMRWTATDDGHSVCFDHDPDVSTWKRIEVQMWRLLPVEGLL